MKLDTKRDQKELEIIYKKNGNKMTPAILLKASAPKESYFHKRIFNCSDSEAVHFWRLERCRSIIQSVWVERESGVREPAWISVRCQHSPVKNNREHKPVHTVREDESAIQEILVNLRGWAIRARSFPKIAVVGEKIIKLVDPLIEEE